MVKDWKTKENKFKREWFLNRVANRFQLNFKRNVGATSESIRECQPRTLEEWREYYFSKVRSKDHLQSLGEKLYFKLKSKIKEELEEIKKDECVDWMLNLVIERTYEGYINEKQIVKEILKNDLNVDIKEASDEWDRLYGVDFYIKIKDKFIGLQIKPQEISQHYAGFTIFLKEQNKKFYDKYKSKVFTIFSIKKGKEKVIQNKEVIEEIKQEIKKLSS